ncbi:MAG TPA: plastocyanin/azurin family copper-binding protein [Gemmatimonadaceae bacterium]|nr:plastocyanin/azurin family copper-binding protein [Gemmatimonadaceae bacterium]
MTIAACGGGGESKPEAASTPATPAATPAAAPAGATAAGTPAPITGKTIEIKMIGDAKGYRFEPNTVTAKAGDALKFIVDGPGGPHNVAFDPTKIPAGSQTQLDANFGSDKMATMSSGLKTAPGETFLLSLGGLPAGKYEFNCTPHLAMGMKGTLTIEP